MGGANNAILSEIRDRETVGPKKQPFVIAYILLSGYLKS